MSVPAHKRTSGHARRRRSHHALKKVVLTKCPKCGRAVEPHKACTFCGNYKNREAIKVKEKKTKTKSKK